jgi:hypothetical protein
MNRDVQRLLSLLKLDAAGAGGGGTGGGASGGDSGSQGGGTGDEGNKGGAGDKAFTQEDLNRIAAKEKGEGKTAALKALGFEDEAAAKAWVDKQRKAEKDAMTESERIKAEKEESDKNANAEKTRATQLEQQLEALKEGANPKTVSDLVLLVRNRMSETVDFKAALTLVKKEQAFASFFGTSSGDGDGGGTGSTGNPPRKVTPESLNGIGKRLAESKSTANKTSYFSN